MSYFRVKRVLLAPYVRLMRRATRKMPADFIAMLEAFYYRPTLGLFLVRARKDPDLLHDAPLDASSVVLDVGAFTGEWSARIVEKYDAHVYLFEPNPECLASLEERFSGNPKVRSFSYGLHAEDASLDLGQDGMGSSVFAEGTKPGVPTTRIALRDVVSVLDELGLHRLDLVKVNIEGGEYDLLERLAETGQLDPDPAQKKRRG